eukprot:14864475-Alexandrium_andersonii.AAC.1
MDFDSWCIQMGLENKGDLRIFNHASGADLGKLYFVWESKHLQAVCRSHKGCKTIVTHQARALECQKDLAR